MKRPATLTARFVETVNKPGRYGDGRGGHGLSLLVKPMLSTGRLSKSWSQRIRIAGRESNIGLGSYPVVTLAEARRAALAYRREIAQGRDPRTGGIPTFEDAAERVIALHEPTWRDGARSAEIWRSSLDTYAYAKLGTLTVDRITTADVLATLMQVTTNNRTGETGAFWNVARETAKRVRQRIGAVMKWAIAEGHRADNPAGDAIAQALPRNGVHRQHQRALPHAAVGVALATVRASGAWWATKAAFELLVLTAARSGEVRGMQWSEIEGRVWTVPGERMKAGRDHRVPLSDRALEVLAEAREHADGSGLVFPSMRGREMSDMTLSKLIKSLGIAAVPHGFRSSFRDWCGESGQPREVAEAALAHVIENKAEAAYARSDLFERRAKLMQEWARYIRF